MGRVALKAESVRASDPIGGNHPATDADAQAASPDLWVRIDNLDEIARAYGPGAALAASDRVETFLMNQLRDREFLGSADYVLRQLSEIPVAYDGQRYHLLVSLAPTGDPKDCANKVMPTVYGNPAFPDDAWCRRYRADMALAVTLFEAMAEDRLALAWQPVRNADDPAAILYHECLLRMDPSGAPSITGVSDTAGPTVEALEQLGLVRALDRHILTLAMAELRIEPFRSLAVNVSALSLVDDDWWTAILEALAECPRIARRLYIEVTETAQFPSIAGAADLLARLRRLGCKIVLDDFGVGHAAIRSILMFAPDAVKIDKFFVQNAMASPVGRTALTHMIGLAEALGAIVIVEGVETVEQARLVRDSGAAWQQGYYHGVPSLSRPWRLGERPSHSAEVETLLNDAATLVATNPCPDNTIPAGAWGENFDLAAPNGHDAAGHWKQANSAWRAA